MSDFWKCQTLEQLENCFNFLRSTFPETGWRIEYKKWRELRSQSMNALQHVIYDELSRYLISRGRNDCTPEWVKDMLKNKYLGWEVKEFTDIETGKKFEKEVLRETSKLDMGEGGFYTDQIIEFAESIGCHIKIPAKGEYAEYREAQIQ